MRAQHLFSRLAPLGAAHTPIHWGCWAAAVAAAAVLSACGGSGASGIGDDSSPPGASPSGYVVTTVAGTIDSNGEGVVGNADGPAAKARLNAPEGVAAGPGGRLYIADTGNNKIRMLSADGTTVSTVAGGGTGKGSYVSAGACYNPIDGPCASATFWSPEGIAVDAVGSIYVADFSNGSVRKIVNPGTASCMVSTLAGSCDSSHSKDGTGSAAVFGAPSGLTLDAAGNVYVADLGNYTIRKITPGGVVTTVAGNNTLGYANGPGASAMFSIPRDIAIDSKGNLYVSDTGNNVIRKITPDGMVSTFAGSGVEGATDGVGANATFIAPAGLAVDSADNLYVTAADDTEHDIVRKITPDRQVTTVAGGCIDGNVTWGPMPVNAACFYNLTGITIDANGAIYLADESNDVIRKIAPAQ
jgi:sugar lactone lactonase YvrE